MNSSVRELLERIYCIGRVWCHARIFVLEQIVDTLQVFLRLPPLTRVIVNLNKKMIFWRMNVHHLQWPPSLLKHSGGTSFQAHLFLQSSLLWAVLAVNEQFLGLWTQWNWFRAHWTHWKLFFEKDGWRFDTCLHEGLNFSEMPTLTICNWQGCSMTPQVIEWSSCV